MKKTLLLLCFCLFFTLSKAQEVEINTSSASCERVCDGQVSFIGLKSEGLESYQWRSDDVLQFEDLTSDRLTDLCSGRYYLKIRKNSKAKVSASFLRREADKGFTPMKGLKFSTLGLKDAELVFSFSQQFNDPNYFVIGYYSIDHGVSWVPTSKIFQINESSASQEGTRYRIDLAGSVNNRREVLIDLHQRESGKKNGIPQLDLIMHGVTGSSTQDMTFDIGVDDHMEIRSLVSNETEGNDGYISLTVTGGRSPYTFNWDNGSKLGELRGLKAGQYKVTVTDRVGCSEQSTFRILSGGLDPNAGNFYLESGDENVFMMTISDLYRQPLKLVLKNALGQTVKEFKINPLYENLKMNLDLSFLKKGDYTAVLTSTGFSEKLSISIN